MLSVGVELFSVFFHEGRATLSLDALALDPFLVTSIC